ncbi:hypothetical protein D3C75_232910 [compost metagenome]
MRRSLLKTSACSSKILSRLNVVRRPFKTNGLFYAAGTVIDDPAAIRLFRNKVNEGKIVQVDEHNLEAMATYLYHKQGVDVADDLKGALTRAIEAEAFAESEELAYKEHAEREAKAAAEKAKAEAEAKAKAEAAEKAKAAALEKAKADAEAKAKAKDATK